MIYAIFLFLVTAFVFLFFRLKYHLNYWKRKRIHYLPDYVFYSIRTIFDNPVPYYIFYKNIYNRLSGHKFGGCFVSLRPQLIIRDMELIKAVLIKDFDHFRDRGSVHYNKYDKMSHTLFTLPGRSLWKNLRANLMQAYTINKMRSMFYTSHKLVDEYVKSLKSADEAPIFDAFTEAKHFAVDVIASTAFGLKIENLKYDSDFNEKISLSNRFSFRSIISRTIHDCFPYLERFNLIKRRSKSVRKFLLGIIDDVGKYRRKNNVSCGDVFQILMDLNENEKQNLKNDEKNQNENSHPEITLEVVAGHIYLYFLAGTHPLSVLISMTLLELCMNRNVKIKLQNEIDSNLSQNNGDITYEMFKNMPYLDKVLRETLRRYPSASLISRICTKPYRLPNSEIIIEKGTEVIIPITGIFNDEKYFPHPEKYDPDRFDKMDKQIKDLLYIPFGCGPRSCIGGRFALLNAKIYLIQFLKRFDFESVPETVFPVQFATNVLFTKFDHPILLKYSEKYNE